MYAILGHHATLWHDGCPDEIITVNNVDRPPVADAGSDQEHEVATVVLLNGSGSSDPDGDALSFFWQFVALPVDSLLTQSDITGIDTALPSFTPDVPGDYVVQLEINDGQVGDSDTVTIHAVATMITISGTVSDSDGFGIPDVVIGGFPQPVIIDVTGFYSVAVASG